MVQTKCLWGVAACIALAVGTASAAPILVDFQKPSGGVTAPGYVAISYSPRWDTGTQVAMGDGVVGGWTSYCYGGDRDRTACPDPLVRDFLTWPSTRANTFKMTGVVPGNYTLTIYSYDFAYPTSAYKTSFGINGNNDGVNETSVSEYAHSPVPVILPVTVSSAGILTIAISATAVNSGIVNGFSLVPVPEPATLGLVLLSAGWMVRRRR